MAQHVVGLFDDIRDAQAVIQELRGAGFTENDVNFVANDARGEYSQQLGDRTVERGGHKSEAAAGAGFGATGGTVMGGIAGLLVGLGAMAIPGIGPVVGAGTLLSTLGTTALGAGIGAAAGGLVGALVGAGIPEEDAHVYAEGVRRGGALVTVETVDNTRADRAIDIMRRYNVVDIDNRRSEYRASGWERFDPAGQPYRDSNVRM